MMDPEKMREILADMNLSAVARNAGVSYGSLYGWLKEDKEPGYKFMINLSQYLESLIGIKELR